ncbi:hypothetical protein PRZ48_006749 [Zasmidium cellare]|uniref:Uncharacterized protein n=1 Tax=Zasmidium cellare TaxID=395010 RepID=A0ABR0EIB9_ZASCE|nr:hypothetical protein PRZ48_006749 [Zasmidium cellare]
MSSHPQLDRDDDDERMGEGGQEGGYGRRGDGIEETEADDRMEVEGEGQHSIFDIRASSPRKAATEPATAPSSALPRLSSGLHLPHSGLVQRPAPQESPTRGFRLQRRDATKFRQQPLFPLQVSPASNTLPEKRASPAKKGSGARLEKHRRLTVDPPPSENRSDEDRSPDTADAVMSAWDNYPRTGADSVSDIRSVAEVEQSVAELRARRKDLAQKKKSMIDTVKKECQRVEEARMGKDLEKEVADAREKLKEMGTKLKKSQQLEAETRGREATANGEIKELKANNIIMKHSDFTQLVVRAEATTDERDEAVAQTNAAGDSLEKIATHLERLKVKLPRDLRDPVDKLDLLHEEESSD